MVKGGGRERREKERETRRDREREGRREQAMDGERDGASDGVKEGGREGGREEGRDGGVSRRVTCRRVGGGASEEWMERWKVGWKKTEDWKCEVEGIGYSRNWFYLLQMSLLGFCCFLPRTQPQTLIHDQQK